MVSAVDLLSTDARTTEISEVVVASALLTAATLQNGMEDRVDYGLEVTPSWEEMDPSPLPEVGIIKKTGASFGPRSTDPADLLPDDVKYIYVLAEATSVPFDIPTDIMSSLTEPSHILCSNDRLVIRVGNRPAFAWTRGQSAPS